MSIKNAKVSFDGSHYIATDSASYPHRKGKKAPRAPVTVEREEFDKAYEESKHLPKKQRKAKISEAMEGLFRTPEIQEQFIAQETAKKNRNFAVRRQRLFRKINLQHWDYFCTFTYDSAKHSEESFKKGLLTCLRHLAHRHGWKYIGAWELSPEKHRLHFHGMFVIPKMIGELIEVTDYNTTTHRMQTTIQNTHFNKKFGRSDFAKIERQAETHEVAMYILKYIEKNGGKVIMSKNLPTFFHSDIADEDILTPFDHDENKYVLADDFTCRINGVAVGKVCREVIEKMPKSN